MNFFENRKLAKKARDFDNQWQESYDRSKKKQPRHPNLVDFVNKHANKHKKKK